MNISNKSAFIIICLVLVGLFIIGGCKFGCTQKDGYTRTCLTDTGNCQFVRTPVDYAMKNPPEGAWQSNPHFIANPQDETQPLEFGNIDFYSDERKLGGSGRIPLWQQYDNNFGGCGNDKEFIVNDEKTRDLLREVGDEGARRILDNMHTPRHGPRTGVPAFTELSLCKEDPYPLNDRIYGSYSYFWRDQLGD